MKPVRDIVSREIIDDLWGTGYTILPRRRHPDPFFVPPEMVPATRAYQWMHLVEDKAIIHSGWVAVPASRHDGYFMPAGHVGDIEVSGLGLFEKPKYEVDAERAESHAKAHQQTEDWIKNTGGLFAGHIKVGGQSAAGYQEQTTRVGGGVRTDLDTKTIETTVAMPPDMLPHMAEVFAERDRLYSDIADRLKFGGVLAAWQDDVLLKYQGVDLSLPKGPDFNALLLPYAIENVRKQLAEDNEARKKS